MKMIYITIAILIIGGLFFILRKSKNDTNSKNVSSNIQDTVSKQSNKDNPYDGLRDMALNTTPEQLQLEFPKDQTKVYGVVMDWDLGDGMATFATFETGDASMYLSTGGGMIGGGTHKNIADAAKAFVAKAQTYLDKTIKTDTTPLPNKDCVRFYLLTNNGKFSAQENLQNFDNNTSPWLPFFIEGNKVITELKIVQEKMQKQ